MGEWVVTLPCSMGDKVYDIYSGKILEKEIIAIEIMDDFINPKTTRGAFMENLGGRLGKTVFFTRIEAEKALIAGYKNNTNVESKKKVRE